MSKYTYYLHFDSNQKRILTDHLSDAFEANCSEALKEALRLGKIAFAIHNEFSHPDVENEALNLIKSKEGPCFF